MTDIVKSSTNPKHYRKICRLCGEESDRGQDLFNSNQEIEQRAVEICSFISVQLKYYRFYPNWICPGCQLQLESTVQFLALIKNGQKLLCERFGELPRRGRRRKEKPQSPVVDDTLSQDNSGPVEDGGKRAKQTPLKFKDTMKGDELDELFSEIGVTKKTNKFKKSKPKLIAHIENEDGNSVGKMLAIPKNPQRTCTRYQCIVCKELFCAEVAFFKHVATHKHIQYECTECETSFGSKNLFDEHQLLENHKGLGIIETPFDAIRGEETSQSAEEVSSTAVAIPEPTTEPPSTEPTSRVTSIKISKCYTCVKCLKSFSTKSSMKRHQATHSNARPFKCDMCGAGFKQRSTLVVHRNSHTMERRFKCNKCPKVFIHRQTLKAHLRMHDGLKPYVCPICCKGFRQLVNLVEHKRIHTGERPYVCLICGSAFKTSSQCRNHQKSHKKAGEQLPEPTEVETVYKTHSCELCKKLFEKKSAMVKHMRTHTGEKPYVCGMCPKTFADPSNFKKHKKVHAKQKETMKIKSVSLLKQTQQKEPLYSEPESEPEEIAPPDTPPHSAINRSLMDLLDEDNKRWGLLRESTDPIITEIHNDGGDGEIAELQPNLSNQLACVSYQDPMNPITSKTTFYVVN